MKDRHKDDWGLQDANQAPREKTKDLGRTNGPKTCSFWERERSSDYAVPNCHFREENCPHPATGEEFCQVNFQKWRPAEQAFWSGYMTSV